MTFSKEMKFTQSFLALASLTVTSCTTIGSSPTEIDYAKAMSSVRSSISNGRIPREKVFYHFQLMQAKSFRGGAGVRGGYTGNSETWELPDGNQLVAIKHIFVGRDAKITPLKEGESFFSSSNPQMFKEEYYNELPLEPYFDSLYLLDANDQRIDAIELDYKKKENKAEMATPRKPSD